MSTETIENTVTEVDQSVDSEPASNTVATEKPKRVTIDAKDIELLDYLRGSYSRTEYLHRLLMEERERRLVNPTSDQAVAVEPVSLQSDDVALGTTEQQWFTVTSKNVDVAEIREALGVESDAIIMTEAELLAKASELSGYTVANIQKQARQTLGQKLITQFCKSRDGRGQAGGADSRLDAAYQEVKAMIDSGAYKGKLTLTAVANRSMTNFNTAKSWAARRGHSDLIPSASA